MVTIFLSELDFDYEIQALVQSFFPGQKTRVLVRMGKPAKTGKELLEAEEKEGEYCREDVLMEISFYTKEIKTSVFCAGIWMQKSVSVQETGDWHRHADKTVHPYRTYYKNTLKKLLYLLLSAVREKKGTAGPVMRIPEWGTMTGVRPTKLPMQELLRGKTQKEVEEALRIQYCCSKEKRELCMAVAQREAQLLRDRNVAEGCSLYIGIPFCPTTCLYCSFPSYPLERFGHLSEAYLQALKKEIAYIGRQCKGRPLTSIYLGGGTPTALTAAQLEELLFCIRESFPVFEEFTVEAGRPDSITEEKLTVMQKHGISRISVNPQTMQQKTLDVIGRKHTVEDTVQAFNLARQKGFTNINMDLIAGLPGEELSDFTDTLQQIKALHPDSLTVHSLVIKRASKLREILETTQDLAQKEAVRSERMQQMMSAAQVFAQQEGYFPYYMYRQKNSAGHFGSSGQENIGFSHRGKECLYNILIMEEKQTIIACGAGSITKRVFPDGKIERCENVKDVALYIEKIDEMIERKRRLLGEV